MTWVSVRVPVSVPGFFCSKYSILKSDFSLKVLTVGIVFCYMNVCLR